MIKVGGSSNSLRFPLNDNKSAENRGKQQLCVETTHYLLMD